MMRRSETSGLTAIFAPAIAGLLLLCTTFAAQAGVKIQEVRSDSGVKAWLVEDYTVPIVSIRFAFEGGSAADPAGKEGLANLMTGLFDEGAGDLDSEAFQIRLDDAGAEMRFNATRDNIYGSLRVVAEHKDAAFDLLRLALTQPRFDAAPVTRIKSQIVAGIRSVANDPQTEAGRLWLRAIYGDHPYARPDEGTEATLAAITADDLRAFHKAVFARAGLHVAVVGAIDAQALKRDLDSLFGVLPQSPNLPAVPDIDPKLDQEVRFDYPLPQASLQLAYPGMARDDPQFFAASLMNHILGGGSFTSRLFREVREKRGLTYGIDSSLVNHAHASSLVIGTSTRADKTEETLGIIREVVAGMAKDGPTEAELTAAKKYVIGAYAINNLNSSAAIAATLVELQIDDLGIDYFDRRVGLINAVTVEQTKEAARRLLTTEPAVLVIGPPSGAAAPAENAN